MLRKVALFGGIAALVGLGSAGVATAQTVDATHYTIACDTINKGSIGFKPALLLPGGPATELISLKGSLAGCTATPDGTNPAITVLGGSIKGLLTGTTNTCTSLLGPSTATGSIVIKWKVAAPIKLLNAATTITIASGNIVGGTSMPFPPDTTSYGLFTLAGASQTGAFGGPSGTGAASITKAITTQGVGALTPLCTGLGIKAVNIGPTELNLQ
jgi:hypothetical protein